MKLIFLFLIILHSSLLFALENEISGNVELQGRKSWNNQEAQDDLFQDWKQEDFYLIYGNLNSIIKKENFKFEANWFIRQSYSDLYQSDYFASQIYTFPNKLVARDMFKLQYDHQEAQYRTESILNKLLLEWNFEDNRLSLGRIYINYGLGETFNPINPFNQPTGLTSISQVAQGNDGGMVTFFVKDNYTIDFMLLGDKRIENYDGSINRTLWIHGEYQASDELQLDYVIGEDQNRQKIGGQVAYRFEDAMVFSQVLYQSHLVNKKISNNLWDIMLGFDQQFTSKWHLRAEGGYQKANRHLTGLTFSDRFLPTEYFISIANIYEIHPLVKLSGTVVNDIKSGFTYVIGKSTYNVLENMEAEVFFYVPASKGDGVDNPLQKLVTTDLGGALRYFF